MPDPTARPLWLMPHETISLAAADGILQADGSLWSHAATLGTYKQVRDEPEFCLDRACVENFVQVFNTGYPQKVPVDYDHAFFSDEPEIVVARGQGKLPKAGTVKELVGVFTADDFTGPLKTAAAKLAAKEGRKLDDARNFGLWMRWEPTPKALQMIQAGEYTELSITFGHNYPDKSGKEQGPTILAVALCNRPFLDEMLPVAASRRDGGSPAAPGTEESSMKNLLASLAAVSGKPVATEDEGIVQLTTLDTEVRSLRSRVQAQDSVINSLTSIAQELEETDPAKALEKLRSLKAENKRFADDVGAQRKARIDEQIAGVRAKFEKKVTPALFDNVIAKQLRVELESGKKKPEETETYKNLAALPEHSITDRSSGADDGKGTAQDGEQKMLSRIKELMQSHPEVKKLFDTRGEHAAYMRAWEIAEQEEGAAASR